MCVDTWVHMSICMCVCIWIWWFIHVYGYELIIGRYIRTYIYVCPYRGQEIIAGLYRMYVWPYTTDFLPCEYRWRWLDKSMVAIYKRFNFIITHFRFSLRHIFMSSPRWPKTRVRDVHHCLYTSKVSLVGEGVQNRYRDGLTEWTETDKRNKQMTWDTEMHIGRNRWDQRMEKRYRKEMRPDTRAQRHADRQKR